LRIELRRVFRAVAVLASFLAAGIGTAFPRQNGSSGGTSGSVHSREMIPAAPPPLRKFEGVLYGRVEAIRTGPAFTGLFLRVALAQPAGGEPVNAQQIAGVIAPIAVTASRDGKPQSVELARSFRAISTGETIWADVRAAGADHILYARHLGPTGAEPGPAATTRAMADTPASADSVRRMEAELRSLRRDLAHLQQDVAELRLRTQELQRRPPLQR